MGRTLEAKTQIVDWPTHTALVERVVVLETKLGDVINNFGEKLEKAATLGEDTNKKITDHVAKEDKWQLEFDHKLETYHHDLTAPPSIKKAVLEKYFWKIFGALTGIPFSLYYLIQFFKALRGG